MARQQQSIFAASRLAAQKIMDESGRTVMTFCTEEMARAKQLAMASRGVALKLVRVTRLEEEIK